MTSEQPGTVARMGEAMQQMNRAVTAWAERVRPALEALTEVANRPEVRAAAENEDSPTGS